MAFRDHHTDHRLQEGCVRYLVEFGGAEWANEVLGPHPSLTWITVILAIMEQLILVVRRRMLLQRCFASTLRFLPM